jgi:hypothetical protein
MFRLHRVVADVPLLPGHSIDTHLVRISGVPHVPPPRPPTSSSSSSSSSDGDSNDVELPVVPDGFNVSSAVDGGNDDGTESADSSVEIIFDSHAAAAARVDAADYADTIGMVNMLSAFISQLPDSTENDEPSFEAMLASFLSTHVRQ